MKRGYDLLKLPDEDVAAISLEYQKTREAYLAKGYTEPLNTFFLISQMYQTQREKEIRTTMGVTREEYELYYKNDSQGVLSPLVEQRFEALQGLTKISVLKKCEESFKNGKPFTFGFNGNMPNAEGKELFNLSGYTTELVNKTRTDALRLNEYTLGTIPKTTEYAIYPEGELVTGVVTFGGDKPWEDKAIFVNTVVNDKVFLNPDGSGGQPLFPEDQMLDPTE